MEVDFLFSDKINIFLFKRFEILSVPVCEIRENHRVSEG